MPRAAKKPARGQDALGRLPPDPGRPPVGTGGGLCRADRRSDRREAARRAAPTWPAAGRCQCHRGEDPEAPAGCRARHAGALPLDLPHRRRLENGRGRPPQAQDRRGIPAGAGRVRGNRPDRLRRHRAPCERGDAAAPWQGSWRATEDRPFSPCRITATKKPSVPCRAGVSSRVSCEPSAETGASPPIALRPLLLVRNDLQSGMALQEMLPPERCSPPAAPSR